MDIKLATGALVGAVYGGFGYAVAKAKTQEDFKPVKFVKTVAIGAILGLSADQIGVDIETLEGISTVGFFTAIIDKFAGLFETKPKAQ